MPPSDLRGSRRTAVLRLVRLALVPLVALVALVACAPVPSDRDTGPPAARAEGFMVERSTWGGLCPEGPCRSLLVVDGDGGWRHEAEDDNSEGRLTDAELSRLREAVEGTQLGSPTAPSTLCAADSDGTSVSYTWTVDGQQHEADSCEVSIDAQDPLVQVLDELAARVDG